MENKRFCFFAAHVKTVLLTWPAWPGDISNGFIEMDFWSQCMAVVDGNGNLFWGRSNNEGI